MPSDGAGRLLRHYRCDPDFNCLCGSGRGLVFPDPGELRGAREPTFELIDIPALPSRLPEAWKEMLYLLHGFRVSALGFGHELDGASA